MYNLLDTEWTWAEVERWWKSQDIISYFYDWTKDCFTFFKKDQSFFMECTVDQFYVIKKDIYLQNLGDETELTRIYHGETGVC